MGSHKNDDIVVVKSTPLNRLNRGRVDLVKNDFDTAVLQKGYDVFVDKAIMCPCRNKSSSQALSSCLNCGGSGWVFINRIKTKAIIQSMNKDTKYKEWSTEHLGNAKTTFLQEQQISFMDRIVVDSGKSVHSEVAFCRVIGGSFVTKLSYDVIQIQEIFVFQGSGVKLKTLANNQWSVNGSIVTLQLAADSANIHTNDTPLTITVRYTHKPTYHIIDIPRDTISSFNKFTNNDFPIHAVARRAHYVLDATNFDGSEYLLNNDYDISCDI